MPRLTKRVVDAQRPRNRDYTVWDMGDEHTIKGFGVRVWPSGRKQFLFQYRANGRTERVLIGDYGATLTSTDDGPPKPGTVDNARMIADEWRAAITSKNESRYPHVIRARGGARGATVATLGTLFLDHISKRKKPAKPQTVREFRRLLDREIVPELGSLSLGAVTRRDVERLLAKMDTRPAVANNVHALLRAMFHYAERRELRDQGKNPCVGWERYERTRRSQSLVPEQYAALGAALERAQTEGLPVPPSLQSLAHGKSKDERKRATGRKRGPYKKAPEHPPRVTLANPVAVSALRFLALSGWREGEALSLRRDAVDARLQVARLADTKTGRSVRPLGKAALAVLEPFLQQPVRGNPYVFPGQHSGQHVKETKRLWIAAKHAAGLEVRLHDLRHSFTTVGRELNYTDSIIAGLVGHVLEGMTSRYGDVPEATLRIAADAIAATIDNRLRGISADVLTLTPRAASA